MGDSFKYIVKNKDERPGIADRLFKRLKISINWLALIKVS